MLKGKFKESKRMVACGAILVLIAASFAGILLIAGPNGGSRVIDNDVRELDNENLANDELTAVSNPKPVGSFSTSRTGLDYSGGGVLDWKFQAGDEELSTPALADLNPPISGRGDLEVIVATAADSIYAVKASGQPFWANPFTDCVIDNARTALGQGLDFDPTPFFSSITPVDIAGSKAPELIVGEKDGILALNPDGTKHWSDKGLTTGYYFSTVGVTDLEGDFAGIDETGQYVGYRDDLELVLGSDDASNANGWLEAWKANGDEVFRISVHVPWEHGFMTNSIVCTEMDGWFTFEDGPPQDVKDNDPETLWQDFLTETHGFPGRIYKHTDGGTQADYFEYAKVDEGHWGGHETYATAAVGNFTKDNGNPAHELEALVGHSDGPGSWTSAHGTFLAYDQDGSILTTKFAPGGAPSAFYSSPAVCDAQNVDEKDLPEGIIKDYEVFVGCDNGRIYSLDVNTLTELWSYQTGGRIMSSPAIANIYSDDMMEVIIGSDDGNVYCFEADPMEFDIYGEAHPSDDGVEDAGGSTGEYDLLWMYETGGLGIGISSPVVADIDNDKMLEVLIGDIGGWLYCIDAGGTCVPGQKDWWKFHGDLNNTGFYNPGTTYGVDLAKGDRLTMDGWKPEILEKSVKPGESVQYNLTVTNVGTSRVASGKDSFFFNTSMIIYQGGKEVVHPITLEPDAKGWSYEITGDDIQIHNTFGLQYVILESMATTNVTLTVNGPWEGEISEFAQIMVEANSGQDEWARDSLTTTTNLEIFLDFALEWDVDPWMEDSSDPRYGQKYIEISPAATEKVKVLLRNKGNINDTYELELTGLIETWDATFTENNLVKFTVTLDADIFEEVAIWKGSDVEIDIYITLPADAQHGDISNIKVTATSQYSKETSFIDELKREDILIVNTKEVPDLELTCDDPQKYVDPGGNVTFEVDIHNNGNAEIEVAIEHSEISIAGWDVVHADDVSVYPQSKKKVSVEVTSPFEALAGDKLIVTMRGSIMSEGPVKASDTQALVAIVKNNPWIEASADPASKSVNPGEIAEYDITVSNKGNGEDFIEISPLILRIEWGDATFEYDEQEFFNSVQAPLAWRKNITIPIRFTIPIEELAGTFTTTINVTGRGNTVLLQLETEINHTYDLRVLGLDDENDIFTNALSRSVSPGWVISYLFEVTNKGNAPETIELELEGLEQEEGEWSGYFSDVANTRTYTTNIQDKDFTKVIDMLYKPDDIAYLNVGNTDVDSIRLLLGVEQKVYVKAKILAPTGLPEGELKVISVKGISEAPGQDDPSDNEVKITFNILFPDLVVEKVNHPKSMEDGEIVTISAYVKNIGDIEAKDVNVVLYVDGKEIKIIPVVTISKGTDDLFITFNWQAVGGEHDIKIEIDPENTVAEKNDQFRGVNNNVASKTIDIGSTDLLGKNIARTVCSILPIIIAAIIIAILIILWKKRGMFRS